MIQVEIESAPIRGFPDLATLFLELADTRPVIWRRVQVSFFSKLAGLHKVIQAVFNWDDSLPHRFVLAGDIYDRVAPGEPLDAKRERNWRLDSALYPDHMFEYVYGEQPTARIRIRLDDYSGRVVTWRYPRCVGGAGNPPPDQDKPFDLGSTNRRLWRRVKRC